MHRGTWLKNQSRKGWLNYKIVKFESFLWIVPDKQLELEQTRDLKQ